MSVEFVGYKGARHVRQPVGSELCFAAIVASMSGADVTEAHQVLGEAELSEADGTTFPMGAAELAVAGSVIAIEPVKDPFDGAADDPETVMAMMDEQFVAGRAVALLHKKNSNPDNTDCHWTLLVGYTLADGQKGAIRAMDPMQQHMNYFRHELVAGMIERSRSLGFYAYALSVSRPDATAKQPAGAEAAV